MLTVATGTLSVHMLVLNLAAGQVSPRAVPEIMADRVTQNAMGTFLGTFVYALSALLLLGFEVVARSGVSLLFLGALLMMLNAEIGRHTSELQSLMRISYPVFCLTKKNN